MMTRRVLMLFAALGLTAFDVSAQETVAYTYDVHGRLVAAGRTTGATTAYAYDGGDNRTSRVTAGGTQLLAEDASAEAEATTGAFDELDPEGGEPKEVSSQFE